MAPSAGTRETRRKILFVTPRRCSLLTAARPFDRQIQARGVWRSRWFRIRSRTERERLRLRRPPRVAAAMYHRICRGAPAPFAASAARRQRQRIRMLLHRTRPLPCPLPSVSPCRSVTRQAPAFIVIHGTCLGALPALRRPVVPEALAVGGPPGFVPSAATRGSSGSRRVLKTTLP